MYPTLTGLVIVLAGLILMFFASLEAMFAYAMICTLMGGAAALIIPALGSVSIPPADVALGFLLLRALFVGRNGLKLVSEALRVNLIYLFYATWALITAMVMPRIFRSKIDVVPMRPAGLRNLFDSFPLDFSSQNITSPAYIFGSFLFAVCAFVAVRQPRGAVVFAKTATVLVCIHAGLGWAGLVLPQSVWSVVTAILRNGSYAQLDQSIGGYQRIAGIMPEASAYASYAIPWFVLCMEFWLRDVLPRRSGVAAVALGITLLASTSSTAYASLTGYVLLLVFRASIFPSFLRLDKVLALIASAVVAVMLASTVFLIKPDLAKSLLDILQHVTVDKMDSTSGMQRAFWAKQGFAAFKISYGLGIGAGSFRSSNIITAIIGSMGVIGVATSIFYVAQVFGPLRQSTFGRTDNKIEAVGVAARWAALCSFFPAMLSAPSPDLGIAFSIFAGVALALRRRSSARTKISSHGIGSSGLSATFAH